MLSNEQVKQWHDNLPANLRDWLKKSRGLSDETINEAMLGWDGECLTIPVKDISGAWLFTKRRYLPEHDAGGSRYKNAIGSNAVLYGIEFLKDADTVLIAEGELDSLILRSNGFIAVSSTGGAQKFEPAWAELFRSIQNVYVIYDNDDAGRTGALKIGTLIPHAKIISLPAEIGEKGDTTDFFMKLGKSKVDLLELLATGKTIAEIDATQKPTDRLEALLHIVPTGTSLATLPNRLKSLWEALVGQDEINPTLFIENNVKEYFDLAKTDMKPFQQEYQRVKRANEAQTKARVREAEKTMLLDRDINSSEVLEAISTIGIVDPTILDLVIAAYVSARLNTIPPIWLMLVGAPSSFKTELVRLIDLPGIYSLDTLTENAFASGYIKPDGSDPEDLLPLLNGKCFVVKDLTTLFSLKEDTIKKILGDLTSIFDGKYEKFTATRGNVSYASRFSTIGCITPAILSQHHRYMHQLGGRFFFVRVPELTEESLKRGHVIAWDATDREERIKNARQIVSTYCHQRSETAVTIFPTMETESAEIQAWINMAATFIAHARGTTMTKQMSFENEEGQTVDYYEVSDPQIEQPWRLLGQLRSLARVIAAMRGKTAVTDEELMTLKPIVLSSMPIDRAVVITELLKADWLTHRETGELINKSSKTAGRDLKELLALGLVDVKEVNDPKIAKDVKGYSLKPEYKAFLTGIQSSAVPF